MIDSPAEPAEILCLVAALSFNLRRMRPTGKTSPALLLSVVRGAAAAAFICSAKASWAAAFPLPLERRVRSAVCRVQNGTYDFPEPLPLG